MHCKEDLMRTLFLLLITLTVSAVMPLMAKPVVGNDTLALLKREVVALFNKNLPDFPEMENQQVTVGFLLNAKNEIIVLDVEGENIAACDYVRDVLNFQKVKFDHARQLTRYQITIHLVKDTA